MLFAEFFTERYFSHAAGLGIGTLDGEVAFLPIRFYCKEINIGARDLLQFRLPTLEGLLRDETICKVVENREEFNAVLKYLSWKDLRVRPFVDALGILQDIGATVNFGRMVALRSIFPSNHAFRGWNSEETICRDNYWQIPNYPRTPTFDKPDHSERVIAAQLIALVIATGRFLINHPPSGAQLSLDQLLKHVVKVLGPRMTDEDGTPLTLPIKLPRNMPRLVTSPIRDDGEGDEERLELQLNDAEMSELLENQSEDRAAGQEGSSESAPGIVRASPRKTVQFSRHTSRRLFWFGDDRMSEEEVVEVKQWPEMERARAIPHLVPSKLMERARWRERGCDLIKRQAQRAGLPLVDERLKPGKCQNRSALKVKTHCTAKTGVEQKVHLNQNDDMTWNFLSKLRHPVPKINSRCSSPVPPYLKRRAVIACQETLAALLVHQYDHDGGFQGRPMPIMTPNPIASPGIKKVFPLNMTGEEIRKFRHLDQSEIRKRFGSRPDNQRPALPPLNRSKKLIVMDDHPIPKSGAQRPIVAASHSGDLIPVNALSVELPRETIPEPIVAGKRRIAHKGQQLTGIGSRDETGNW